VKLRVGEALSLAPTAMVGLDSDNEGALALRRLAVGFLKIRSFIYWNYTRVQRSLPIHD
jgi:hypothetical protein